MSNINDANNNNKNTSNLVSHEHDRPAYLIGHAPDRQAHLISYRARLVLSPLTWLPRHLAAVFRVCDLLGLVHAT